MSSNSQLSLKILTVRHIKADCSFCVVGHGLPTAQ